MRFRQFILMVTDSMHSLRGCHRGCYIWALQKLTWQVAPNVTGETSPRPLWWSLAFLTVNKQLKILTFKIWNSKLWFKDASLFLPTFLSSREKSLTYLD